MFVIIVVVVVVVVVSTVVVAVVVVTKLKRKSYFEVDSQVSLAEPGSAAVQQQFENGDVVVTLLPVNERFPWVTPAR